MGTRRKGRRAGRGGGGVGGEAGQRQKAPAAPSAVRPGLRAMPAPAAAVRDPLHREPPPLLPPRPRCWAPTGAPPPPAHPRAGPPAWSREALGWGGPGCPWGLCPPPSSGPPFWERGGVGAAPRAMGGGRGQCPRRRRWPRRAGRFGVRVVPSLQLPQGSSAAGSPPPAPASSSPPTPGPAWVWVLRADLWPNQHSGKSPLRRAAPRPHPAPSSALAQPYLNQVGLCWPAGSGLGAVWGRGGAGCGPWGGEGGGVCGQGWHQSDSTPVARGP